MHPIESPPPWHEDDDKRVAAYVLVSSLYRPGTEWGTLLFAGERRRTNWRRIARWLVPVALLLFFVFGMARGGCR